MSHVCKGVTLSMTRGEGVTEWDTEENGFQVTCETRVPLAGLGGAGTNV